MTQSNHLPDDALPLEEDQAVFWRRAEEGANAHGPPNVFAPARLAAVAAVHAHERRILVSSRATEQLYEIAPDEGSI